MQTHKQPHHHHRMKFSKSNDEKALSAAAHKRLKNVEISVPIVYGSVAFHLDRNATDVPDDDESVSHKWTVYVRGATNADLGAIISRVVFQLHPSFNNPTRVVQLPPFELSAIGWGEFQLGITIYFHADVCDKKLELYHNLKLYHDDASGQQLLTKKPCVAETYNEIVFPEPSEAFFTRVQNHPAVVIPRTLGFNLPTPAAFENMNERESAGTKDHPLSQWFTNFSEADELLKLAAARQQVQAHIAKLKRQLSVMDGPPHDN
ncbi:hypothetical protein ACFE04_022308 [Oxalis oulophora]